MSFSEREAERCMILELPEEVTAVILSFQLHKDRLSVAATCGDFWKAIEAFSEQKLDEFRANNPNRDDDWEERIADPSAIETSIPQRLLELPYRYLLWKSFRVHLYSLGERAHETRFVQALPDGKSIVTAGNDNMVRLWNLSTRENSVIFDGNRQRVAHMLVCGRNVIISFVGRLVVTTLSGHVVHDFNFPRKLMIPAHPGNQQKVFVTDRLYSIQGNISCFDLVTGDFQENVITWERADHHGSINSFISTSLKVLVCDNMLIVWHYFLRLPDDGGSLESHPDGIYVFDLDYSQKQFIAESYCTLTKAVDDERTIIGGVGFCIERRVDVLVLGEDGHLFRAHTFTINPGFGLDLAFKSHVYVNQSILVSNNNGNNGRNKIEVYNIQNGEKVNTFEANYDLLEVEVKATNGKELFFLNTIAFEHRVVMAYNLKTCLFEII